MQDDAYDSGPGSLERLEQTYNFLGTSNLTWAICGGWAISLWLERRSRRHGDIDIAILRSEQQHWRDLLLQTRWQVNFIADHQEYPWNGEPLTLPVHQIRARRPGAAPDHLELLMNDSAEERWQYRRNHAITYPLDQTILLSQQGIPILAPEICLLFKSTASTETKNADDFERTLASLDGHQRAWLSKAIALDHPDHEWLALLRA